MAWTNVGFDGTITEIQWAGMASLLGNDYVAASATDCAVTAVGGARQVSVAAGSLYGDGVVSTNSGAETVALTTPVNGQWYVIALRRTWASNTAALVAIAGATTSTSTPTAAPTSFPTLNTDPGILTDQPIAWAWCNSANTTVVVYDIRKRAVKSLPPIVATSAERDAKFMTPTQGTAVWRDDLGAVETYYDLYNSTTNPGGRDTAGWYVDTRQTGMRPIQPTSAVIATGSGTVNALGKVTFTGATKVTLNNVFSSKYSNYIIDISRLKFTGTWALDFRLVVGGVESSTSIYDWANWITRLAGTTQAYAATSTGARHVLGVNTANEYSAATISIKSPAIAAFTNWTSHSSNYDTSFFNMVGSGAHNAATAYDGIAIYPTGGTVSGTIIIYGVTN